MTTFPIRSIDRSRQEAVEALGSKPKFWFRDGEKRILFKAEERGTGEDWAEVVACHLAALLGLPHVVYELASEFEGEQYLRPGVICENMASPPVALILGNQLLLALDPAYPTAKRFHVAQHTVDAVARIVRVLKAPPSQWMASTPNGINTAPDVFVGYAMLDAWIANQDRHHENWGALSDHELCLAPTYDHGAALARNVRDEERNERLVTRDRNRTIAAFAERARSAFYTTSDADRALSTLDAFEAFATYSPQAREIWLNRLGAVNRDEVWAILERVPTERMSDICKRFTLELLCVNQERLLKLRNP